MVFNDYSVHAMNTRLENSSSDREQQLTLELLQAIDRQDDISQRHLAEQMGVALGLANSYLKRCVKKGWIKITTAPANRYLYYLTPNGFAEKARLTGEFLSTSLALFRQSGNEYTKLIQNCESKRETKLVFAGVSDLTEIAMMRITQSNAELVGIYDPHYAKNEYFGVEVFREITKMPRFDALILTSMEQTIDLLEQIEQFASQSEINQQQIYVPDMLLNMRYRLPEEN